MGCAFWGFDEFALIFTFIFHYRLFFMQLDHTRVLIICIITFFEQDNYLDATISFKALVLLQRDWTGIDTMHIAYCDH